MNEVVIFDGCPAAEAWLALDAAAKRQWAKTVLERVVDDLVASGVRPDPWESTMIANAITAFGSGFFTLVLNDVALAMAPKAQQSPLARLESLSLADLDVALKNALARGA